MLDFSQNRLNTDQIDWKYESVYFKFFTSLAATTEVKEYALSFFVISLEIFYVFLFIWIFISIFQLFGHVHSWRN